MTSVCSAYITSPSEAHARELARGLIEQQLAACVNIVSGATSVYRWEGDIQEDQEWLLWAKTTKAQQKALVAYVLTQHPYDCPCIVFYDIAAGHPPYLDWIAGEVNEAKKSA